jgi:hypothetical protein
MGARCTRPLVLSARRADVFASTSCPRACRPRKCCEPGTSTAECGCETSWSPPILCEIRLVSHRTIAAFWQVGFMHALLFLPSSLVDVMQWSTTQHKDSSCYSTLRYLCRARSRSACPRCIPCMERGNTTGPSRLQACYDDMDALAMDIMFGMSPNLANPSLLHPCCGGRLVDNQSIVASTQTQIP